LKLRRRNNGVGMAQSHQDQKEEHNPNLSDGSMVTVIRRPANPSVGQSQAAIKKFTSTVSLLSNTIQKR
jgi:hypothetical protein